MNLNTTLSQLVATRQVSDRMAEDWSFAKHVTKALGRFIGNDWGDLCDEDKQQNDEALKTEMRILASYGTGDDNIWIIKDAYDGPVTVLYPSEY
jgi:hypothetical protein|tara:strand:- start:2123 stop:2404 length:282 start_codon:yes stop_codon:yes gene_type:complete